MLEVAEAETVLFVEGYTSDAATRGTAALPGSKTSSRTKGTRRNLGDLMSGRAATCRVGPQREGEEP